MTEKEIGKITHYYSHLNVGIVELKDMLKVGEEIRIKGHATDLTQKVDSIQIEHQSVPEAKAGDVIGIKVAGYVRQHDSVYKIIP